MTLDGNDRNDIAVLWGRIVLFFFAKLELNNTNEFLGS